MTYMMGLDCRSLSVPRNRNEFRRSFSQNTGNLLFHFAIECIAELENEKLPWSFKKGGHTDSLNALIPMANLLGPHIDLSERGPRIDAIGGAITVMGLGAQFGLGNPDISMLPRGSLDWINRVSRNDGKANIGVRGNFTLRILKKMGCADAAVALGCPSNFISSDRELGETLKQKFKNATMDELKVGTSLTAGSFQRKEFWELERCLLDLLVGGRGSYFVQNPWELIALSMGWYDEVDNSLIEKVRRAWFPNHNVSEMKEFFVQRGEVYISVPQWLLNLTKNKFVVGTRIHGVQAALQAGVPAVCLCIDSRTKELCEFMKLPYLMAPKFKSGISLEDLVIAFQRWDHGEYDARRLMLARRTRKFLEENGIVVKKHLLNFCSQ